MNTGVPTFGGITFVAALPASFAALPLAAGLPWTATGDREGGGLGLAMC